MRCRFAARIYEVDPLVCRECGSEMKILAFSLDPAVPYPLLKEDKRTRRVTGGRQRVSSQGW